MTSYTNDIKRQIERILHWEPSSHWRPRDFMQLSERVLAHTNCWVEPHDLQTFWRSSEATPGLLDALAQFADYTNWADFCDRNQVGEMVPVRVNAFHSPKREIPAQWVTIIWWFSIVMAVAVGILLVWKR